MNPILYAIPVFLLMIALECAWAWKVRGNQTPQAGGGSRRLYDFADTIGSIQIGVLSRVAVAFPRLLTVGLYFLVHQQFAVGTWDLQNPLHWVAALLIYDFFYYWKHRANHEVRLMWAGHITHHNSEYFNLSTALRQSSTTFVFDWMFYLPMAVMGVPVQMFVVVALIDLVYQFWVHTELLPKMGWFDRVFVSPSNHRVHHGQDDYCIDKNYGGILIVWDRLFGTFAEERDQPIAYGVRTPLQSFNPLWGNLHYYVLIGRDFKAARGWAAKLEALFAPPSGWHGEKLEPFDAASFKRHEVPVRPGVRRYVMVQHALNVVGVCVFLFFFKQWAPWQGALAAAWMVGGLVATTALMEGRRWGLWLEVARWLAAPGLAIALWGTGLAGA